jgi:hypothetical protein
MVAAPADDAARLRFHARLADSALFLPLVAEPQGADAPAPRVFALEDGPVVLAFDSEERLAAFAGGVADYAELPGRAVVAALAGQGVGLGLNLGVAPSSILLPAEAVDWLADVLAQAPAAAQARPVGFRPPDGLPETLLAALDATLARAEGLAAAALLAGVAYADGRRGHLLAVLGAAPSAEPALARAVGEAVTFSGMEAGGIDVTFLARGDPALAPLSRVALRFDLPKAAVPAADNAPRSPGSNPDRPPRLR